MQVHSHTQGRYFQVKRVRLSDELGFITPAPAQAAYSWQIVPSSPLTDLVCGLLRASIIPEIISFGTSLFILLFQSLVLKINNGCDTHALKVGKVSVRDSCSELNGSSQKEEWRRASRLALQCSDDACWNDYADLTEIWSWVSKAVKGFMHFSKKWIAIIVFTCANLHSKISKALLIFTW